MSTLNVYPSPTPNGDYLAVLKVSGELPEPVKQSNAPTCNIIILDVSGSMGWYVEKCCKVVFPALFEQRGFKPDDEINLLRFECNTYHNVHKVKDFPTLNYSCMGGTDLRGVFPFLTTLLEAQAPGTHVRILTVSDGDVSYADQTCELASTLNKRIQNDFNLQIDSTAIRLFTSSYANPDTRALSSVLQFNTTSSTPSLVDIVSGTQDAQIIELMLPHYGGDIAMSYCALPNTVTPTLVPGSDDDAASPNALFKQHPWSKVSCKLPLRTLKTLFWISKEKYDAIKPTKFTLSDVSSVDITFHEEGLTSDLYEEIIASRIDYYMMQIKLLRVVGTAASVDRLKEMSKYFIDMETELYKDAKTVANLASESENATSLKERIRNLTKNLKKENSRLGLKMAEIANMDSTTRFNAAQAASFLRSTSGSGSASKGLVRRAGEDLDFDDIVRGEVNKMAKNYAELEVKMTPEIESNLKSSFVSLATTMDGIRAVVELARTSLQGDEIELSEIGVRESILNTIPAMEILSFLNIVGIPVQSTIGDYPDPYRYNINVMFTGHYCSLSDLMTLHTVREDANGVSTASLNVPGYKGDSGRIDNVVPLVENKDIFDFLHKHAPRVMSLYSSVGMRRVMVDIWETPHATLCAALLKLMRIVLVEPSDVNFNALHLVYKYMVIYDRLNPSKYVQTELGNAISHLQTAKNGEIPAETTATEAQSDDKPVADKVIDATKYIDTEHKLLPHIQTQITTLMYPLVKLFQSKKILLNGSTFTVNDDELSTLFRAVYYNEVWNAVRSTYRGKPDGPQIIKDNINSLIGFDANWEPKLTSLYEQDAPFDLAQIDGANKNAFFKSSTWKALSGRLSRLNVILSIPYFAELFEAFEANNTDMISSLQSSIVKTLATPETASLLQKQQQLNQLRAKLGGVNADADADDDDDDDDFDENFGNGISDEEKVQIKTQIAELVEEQQGQRQEVSNNVEVAWAKVFFNVDVDGETVHSSYQHVNYMKLMAIISAFLHTEGSDRFPQGQYTPQNMTLSAGVHSQQIYDIDYTDDLAKSGLVSLLKSQSNQLYERAYNAAVNAKVKKATGEVFVKYRGALVETEDINVFKTLLKDGLTELQFAAKYTGFQDAHFSALWSVMVDKDAHVPLRCDKLKILILGQDEDKNEVWNQGRILFDYPLKVAAVFFYDEDRRGEWIEISKEYQERRKWQYRSTDLPNRHSHHLSRPSYYGFGYDSLVDFRAAVGDEKYNEYCVEHKDCCGLTPVDQKRKRAGPKRHKKEEKKEEAKPE